MQKKNQQCKKMNKSQKEDANRLNLFELKKSIYATITAPLILLFKFIQNENLKSFLFLLCNSNHL
jgi:hypothetical protein